MGKAFPQHVVIFACLLEKRGEKCVSERAATLPKKESYLMHLAKQLPYLPLIAKNDIDADAYVLVSFNLILTFEYTNYTVNTPMLSHYLKFTYYRIYYPSPISNMLCYNPVYCLWQGWLILCLKEIQLSEKRKGNRAPVLFYFENYNQQLLVQAISASCSMHIGVCNC